MNDLPVTNSEVNETPYDNIASLTDASDLVIVGEVLAVRSIGTPDEAEDPHASEYFMVTVQPEKTLKGTAPSAVTIAWEGFITDGSGNRTLRVERSGVGMPELGMRVLLYLLEESRERSDFFGGEISHRLNTLDGILFVGADGRLTTPLHGENRPAHQLSGSKVDEIGSLSEASG
ncbi:MAG: hypothetical protein P1T08_18740 [Acidimicrobiia bacterium]|nr:hypothetical protein [Acidimicrobiia bacterium]